MGTSAPFLSANVTAHLAPIDKDSLPGWTRSAARSGASLPLSPPALPQRRQTIAARCGGSYPRAACPPARSSARRTGGDHRRNHPVQPALRHADPCSNFRSIRRVLKLPRHVNSSPIPPNFGYMIICLTSGGADARNQVR